MRERAFRRVTISDLIIMANLPDWMNRPVNASTAGRFALIHINRRTRAQQRTAPTWEVLKKVILDDRAAPSPGMTLEELSKRREEVRRRTSERAKAAHVKAKGLTERPRQRESNNRAAHTRGRPDRRWTLRKREGRRGPLIPAMRDEIRYHSSTATEAAHADRRIRKGQRPR